MGPGWRIYVRVILRLSLSLGTAPKQGCPLGPAGLVAIAAPTRAQSVLHRLSATCNRYTMPVVSMNEASKLTGISRMQLWRMLKDGRIKDFERGEGAGGARLLEVRGLREACVGRMRMKMGGHDGTAPSAHFRRPPRPPLRVVDWADPQDQALADLDECLTALAVACIGQIQRDPESVEAAVVALVQMSFKPIAQFIVDACEALEAEEQADG